MNTALEAIIIFTAFLVAIISFLSLIQSNYWSRPSFFMVRLVMKYKEKEEMEEGKKEQKEEEDEGKDREKGNLKIDMYKIDLLIHVDKSLPWSDSWIQITPGIYILVVLALFSSLFAFLSDKPSPNSSKGGYHLLQVLVV